MKKLIAVLCLSLAVLIPKTTEAFVLYTPAFNYHTTWCSILNVGNITLLVDVAAIRYTDGTRIPSEPEWVELLPGGTGGVYVQGLGQDRCVFQVKAKNPRRTATRNMVRAGVVFSNSAGTLAVPFEAK
jgi:hypothetical protein